MCVVPSHSKLIAACGRGTKVVVVFASMAMIGSAADALKNLQQIRRDRDYTVVMRTGSCVTGRIAEVGNAGLRLNPVDQQVANTGIDTTVPVKDVLRVTDNRLGDPHDTIYSGRSSWSDVVESRPKAKAEWLKVVDKSGNERTCKSAQVSESGFKCGRDEISKREIARVYYVRLKPASDWLEYASKEGVGWLDARTWFNYALLGRIDVLLFDSALPEDNQRTTCRLGGH